METLRETGSVFLLTAGEYDTYGDFFLCKVLKDFTLEQIFTAYFEAHPRSGRYTLYHSSREIADQMVQDGYIEKIKYDELNFSDDDWDMLRNRNA